MCKRDWQPHLLNSRESAGNECGSGGTPSRMSLPLVFSRGSSAVMSCCAATVSMMASSVPTAAWHTTNMISYQGSSDWCSRCTCTCKA